MPYKSFTQEKWFSHLDEYPVLADYKVKIKEKKKNLDWYLDIPNLKNMEADSNSNTNWWWNTKNCLYEPGKEIAEI